MTHAQRRCSAVAALAIALACAMAPLTGCTLFRSRTGPATHATARTFVETNAVSPSSFATETLTESSATSESAPAYSAITTQPDLPAAALDAFIAQQYPGYAVKRRISLPNMIDAGRLSVAYLLSYARDPRFLLLVNVAQLGPTETPADADDSHYGDLVGRVLTNDEVFSTNAAREYPALAGGGQAALISAYVAHRPVPDAIAHDAYFDPETGLDMGLESGAGALSRALENFGSAGNWEFEASVPSNASVVVTVTPVPQLPY